ncbi:MAG: chorismate mutase [Clostridia bacterium]|nr:chorismate mutase [Clostridia bacterium]
MKNTLEKLRKSNDKIDKKLIKLFCKRMKNCREIGAVKKAENAEIFDAKREAEVLSNSRKYANGEFENYALEFMKSTVAISKELQKTEREKQ